MPRKKSAAPQSLPSVTKEYHAYCLKQMPVGAIKADLTKHAPHNSYSPPMWYVDEHRKCVACGQAFTFTARQQKHWFETLKIPIYVMADRCVSCRRKRREELAAQQKHMAEMARRPRHPHEAFFRQKKT